MHPVAAPCYDPWRRRRIHARGELAFIIPWPRRYKELALYVQDAITKGTGLSTWAFAAISTTAFTASEAEPRLGVAYNIKPTNTVLRASYARTLETPFNENLVLSPAWDAATR